MYNKVIVAIVIIIAAMLISFLLVRRLNRKQGEDVSSEEANDTTQEVEIGEDTVEYGNGLSGQRPATASDELESAYTSGAGSKKYVGETEKNLNR